MVLHHYGTAGQTPVLWEFTIRKNPSGTKSVQIINRVQADWKRLADHLHLPAETARNLESQPGYNPECACREVFSIWLDSGDQSRVPKNWNTVIEVIGELGNQTLGKDIETVLNTP